MNQLASVPNITIFKQALIKKLSEEETVKIERAVFEKYQDLLLSCNTPAEKALKYHLENFILPGIALYQALLSLGYGKQQALSLVNEAFEAWATKPQQAIKLFSRIPFYFQFMRLSIKKLLSFGFPEQGWNIEWLENSSKKMAFNMKSCFYHKTLTAYGVPELTPLYCNVDVVMYSEATSSVLFERSKTIAQGDPICNFQFVKSH